MRILVVGSGSLALSVIHHAQEKGHDVAAMRGSFAQEASFFTRGELERADLVLNCHGQNPKRNSSAVHHLKNTIESAVTIASWARDYDVPLLQVSTDCVLGHRSTHEVYDVNNQLDVARPDDAYGFAMAFREEAVRELGGNVLRTSFVTPREGIWNDVVHHDTFSGWTKAFWSGGSVHRVAEAFLDYGLGLGRVRCQLRNLAMEEPLSKYAVAVHLVRMLGYECRIERDDKRIEDRALAPSRPSLTLPPFQDETAYTLNECATVQLQADPFPDVWVGTKPWRRR
jgi:dTDP-4-dehydrorhamnose reductase